MATCVGVRSMLSAIEQKHGMKETAGSAGSLAFDRNPTTSWADKITAASAKCVQTTMENHHVNGKTHDFDRAMCNSKLLYSH